MNNSTDENGIQVMEDVPDWSSDTPERDPDEPTGYEDYEQEEEADTPAVPGYIATPEADLQFQRVNKALQEIHEYQKAVEQHMIAMNEFHEQAEDDHEKSLTNLQMFQSEIVLLHRYINGELRDKLSETLEDQCKNNLAILSDVYSQKLLDIFSSAVAEMDKSIAKTAVAAETVRILQWQQFLKQTLIAVVASAITAPLSIFIFKALLK
jgi:hypothetical protein